MPGQHERQRGEQPAGEEREAEHAHEVGRQPREVEVQPVAEREVHRADGVEIPAPDERAPRRLRLVPAGPDAVLLDPGQLRRRRPTGGRRADRDTTRAMPRPTRGRACRRRRSSRASPSAAIRTQRDGRRQHPADARAEEEHAVGLAALARGEPPRERARDVGKGARLARAEEKPDRQERRKAARGAGQHREGRPPQHDARQHAPRTADVAQPSRRNLEQRVGERERAEHQLISRTVRWSSSIMNGAAAEMQMRSR